MADYTYTVTVQRTDTGELMDVHIQQGQAIHVRIYARCTWWNRAAQHINGRQHA